MQFMRGSLVVPATVDDVITWAIGHKHIVLDLGTGDGCFVMEQSRKFPETAAIGVDLCAANLREASRKAGRNARFLAADACTLPEEVLALADHINIAFSWGRFL